MSAPYYSDDLVTIYLGDSLHVLTELPDCSVDSVVTDPPYGIGFMGHEWDQPGEYAALSAGHGGSNVSYGGAPHPAMEAGRYDLSQSANARFGLWCEAWARECLRILKPGGHLMSFGGARTWHRLQCAIEDAGFEIRDSIAWLFGSGFPKSLDVSKAIDKAAGAEREVVSEGVAVKRMIPGADQNRTGSWIKDNGREFVPTVTAPATDTAAQWAGWGTALKPAFEPIVVGRKPLAGTVAGNVLTYGTGALNIDACRIGDEVRINPPGSTNPRVAMGDGWRPDAAPRTAVGRWPTNVVLDDTQAAELDRQTGVLTSGANPTRRGSDKFRNAYGDFVGQEECTPARGADSGGASRFFPTFHYEAKAPTAERPVGDDGTAHPTVKPLDLMRWLVRLVTPAGGTVLEPFLGSGTTAEACVIEGFRCIGIERHEPYAQLAVARLTKPIQQDMFGGVA